MLLRHRHVTVNEGNSAAIHDSAFAICRLSASAANRTHSLLTGYLRLYFAGGVREHCPRRWRASPVDRAAGGLRAEIVSAIVPQRSAMPGSGDTNFETHPREAWARVPLPEDAGAGCTSPAATPSPPRNSTRECSPCSAAPPNSYDLAKLRAKGLVAKRPNSRRYRLLPQGYSICLIFLKLFERVYAPLTAGVLSPFTADARIDQQKWSQLDRL